MTARSLGAAFGLALVLCTLSLPAAPAKAANEIAAKKYVDAGNQAYLAGRYELAVRAYDAAFRLMPLPAIAFSMAQAERLQYYQDRDLDHLRRARDLYLRYLDEAPSGNRRRHATLHLEAIESILGPIPPPASAPAEPAPPKPPATELMVVSRTPNARARIDGGDFLDVPFDRKVAPGKRTVEVEAAGYAPARAQWLAVEGRLVVASLDLVPLPSVIHVAAPVTADVRIDGKPLAAPKASVKAGVHTVTVTSPGCRPIARRVALGPGERTSVEVPELEPTDRRIAAYWMLGGAGALAVAGGVTTVLALSAEGRVRDYDRGIGQRTYTESERADRNSALEARNRYRTASWALLGGAAALGITGGVLWWFDHPSAGPTLGAVGPLVAPESGGVTWRTAF